MQHGWLETWHTFSFDRYYDPEWMQFGKLRVLNEDIIQPGSEFPDHPHRDMEIVTYVIDGTLQHRDNMGNGSVIQAGDIQYMCAGTGVMHSERNPREADATHLYQIWIPPDQSGHTPAYDQKSIASAEKHNRFCLLISPDGADGSIAVHQDILMFATSLEADQALRYTANQQRTYWVQVVSGKIRVNGMELGHGAGAGITMEEKITILADKNSEFLLFDMV
jgi:quercetin 2,3-dioxygenase